MKSWWIQVVDNRLISSIDMQNTESCKNATICVYKSTTQYLIVVIDPYVRHPIKIIHLGPITAPTKHPDVKTEDTI